jgi:hypothetical protein
MGLENGVSAFALGGWRKGFYFKNLVLWLLFSAAKNRNGVEYKSHRHQFFLLVERPKNESKKRAVIQQLFQLYKYFNN